MYMYLYFYLFWTFFLHASKMSLAIHFCLGLTYTLGKVPCAGVVNIQLVGDSLLILLSVLIIGSKQLGF